MGRETKSNGQKDIFDRFYTTPETVKKCLSLIDFSQYDCIIEPSAGTGNFTAQFPKTVTQFNFDLNPEADYITQADWLKVDKTPFFSYNSVLVCGNPPFGQQNTLAIRFFNEAASFSDTIAFILPLSFKKGSVQNRLNRSFHLVDEIILNDCEFLLKNEERIKVPCVFQVWKRFPQERELFRLKTTTALFDFVDKTKADFRIQRVGGNAGKASFDLTKSPSSNYFIKNNTDMSNEDFVNFVNQLVFPTIEFTVGPKSLSKGELVAVIEENWE
ncbi:MAG: hypothetical protein IJZ40_06930 [Bacteroidaceae bacterium]|nr:hypothetical protein [Bacteroidaceae bacterium]